MYQEVVCRVIVYCMYKTGIFTVLFPFRVCIITTVELHVSVGSLWFKCCYLDYLYLYSSGHNGMIIEYDRIEYILFSFHDICST
jgi:hypothetical protein